MSDAPERIEAHGKEYIRLDLHEAECDRIAEDYQQVGRYWIEESEARDRAVACLQSLYDRDSVRIGYGPLITKLHEIIEEHRRDREPE